MGECALTVPRRYDSPPAESPRRKGRGRQLGGALAALGLGAALVGGVLFFNEQVFAPPAPPTSDAQPFIRRDFANDLQGEVHTKLAEPEVFQYSVPIDGCDRNYGVRGECVPYNFPPQVANNPADKCAYLAKHEFKSLELVGTDRHKLVPAGGPVAPSGNPYACPAELPTGS